MNLEEESAQKANAQEALVVAERRANAAKNALEAGLSQNNQTELKQTIDYHTHSGPLPITNQHPQLPPTIPNPNNNPNNGSRASTPASKPDNSPHHNSNSNGVHISPSCSKADTPPINMAPPPANHILAAQRAMGYHSPHDFNFPQPPKPSNAHDVPKHKNPHEQQLPVYSRLPDVPRFAPEVSHHSMQQNPPGFYNNPAAPRTQIQQTPILGLHNLYYRFPNSWHP